MNKGKGGKVAEKTPADNVLLSRPLPIIKPKGEGMSKILNGVGGLAIVYVIGSGLWSIFNYGDYSTAEIQGIQLYGGILDLAIGIGLLVIFLQIKRR